MTTEEKAKAYDEALESIKELYSKSSRVVVSREEFETIFPKLKESEDERNKTVVDSKPEGLSKGTEETSDKNVRPLSSMTDIEREEWALILTEELEEDPYSWLVRHNFLEDTKIDIGLSKSLKGPIPPIYL